MNNGTLIDNDVAAGIPGQFAFDVRMAGRAISSVVVGISAQGNTQLLSNENVIFDFTNYIDVGCNGGALDLRNSIDHYAGHAGR